MRVRRRLTRAKSVLDRFNQMAALVQSNSILYIECGERSWAKMARYGLI